MDCNRRQTYIRRIVDLSFDKGAKYAVFIEGLGFEEEGLRG